MVQTLRAARGAPASSPASAAAPATPEPGSEALALAAQAGDQRALSQLLARHQHEVYRVALRMLGRPHEAEEVVQDTYERLLRHLARYDPARPFRPWLITIALNRVRNLLRWRSLRRWVSLEEEPGGAPSGPVARGLRDQGPAPDRQLAQAELQAVLLAAMQSLPAAQREVFVLRHVEGLSFEEVAAITGDSVGSLKVRAHRARRALVSYLAARGVTADEAGGTIRWRSGDER